MNESPVTTTGSAPADSASHRPIPKQRVALPLHVQKLQGALSLDKLLDQVERAFNESLSAEKTVRYVNKLTGVLLMNIKFTKNLETTGGL